MTRVLVTRSRESFDAAASAVAARGWTPFGAPFVEIVPRGALALAPAMRAVESGQVDVIVFTSANGVREIVHLAPQLLRAKATYAAIGPRTAHSLSQVGITPTVPTDHSSRGLVSALSSLAPNARVLVLRSSAGTPELAQGLAAVGVRVLDIPVYDVALPRDPSVAVRAVHEVARNGGSAFTFASSQTFRNFLHIARDEGLEAQIRGRLAKGVVAAIGRPTRETIETEGLDAIAVPAEAQFEALLDAVEKALLDQAENW